MRSTLDQFPLPWVVQERSTCFVVHDKTSHPLAYIHFEDKSGRTADRGEYRQAAGAFGPSSDVGSAMISQAGEKSGCAGQARGRRGLEPLICRPPFPAAPAR